MTSPQLPSESTRTLLSRSSSSSLIAPGVVTTSIFTILQPTMTPPQLPSVSMPAGRSSSSSLIAPGVVTTSIFTISQPTTAPPQIPSESMSARRSRSSSLIASGVVTTSVITISQPTTTPPQLPSESMPARRSGSSSLIAPGVVTTSIITISQPTMIPPQPSSTLATDTRTTINPPKITDPLIAIRDGIAFTINSTPTVIPASALQSQTSNTAPIVGGAVAGFFFIGIVAITWFIRKKCRKSNAVSMEEKAIVFPGPVNRGGDQPDFANESKPYKSGFLGRSTQMTGPGRSPRESHDGRPDSLAALIDV